MLQCTGWGETACTIAHLFVLFPQARVETLFTVRLILHIREVFHLVVSKSLPIPIHGSRLHGPWPQCETTNKVGKGSSDQVWQVAQVRMPGWVQLQQSFATCPVKLKMISTWRPIWFRRLDYVLVICVILIHQCPPNLCLGWLEKAAMWLLATQLGKMVDHRNPMSS